MDRSLSIMRSRIDKLGVAEPEIRKQGNNQIVIQLAGVHDVNKAAQIIGTTAQLQFFDFEEDVFGPSTDGSGQVVAHGSLYDLLTKVKADTKNGGSQYYLFNAKKQKVAGPEDTRERLLNSTLPRIVGRSPWYLAWRRLRREQLVELGVARELARSVLPVGAYTEFYWTVNARSLMNFLSLRNSETAQREIRRYAEACERFLEDRMPVTYAAFVANDRTAP